MPSGFSIPNGFPRVLAVILRDIASFSNFGFFIQRAPNQFPRFSPQFSSLPFPGKKMVSITKGGANWGQATHKGEVSLKLTESDRMACPLNVSSLKAMSHIPCRCWVPQPNSSVIGPVLSANVLTGTSTALSIETNRLVSGTFWSPTNSWRLPWRNPSLLPPAS